MTQPPMSDPALLQAALTELDQTPAGAPSGPAVQALVHRLAPVIRHRIARHLLTHRGPRPGEILPLLDEFTQMVFGKLFEERAHLLRLWQPEEGLSLCNWVGRVASLRTRDVLRSKCHDPFRDPSSLAFGATVPDASTPQDAMVAKELWEHVLEQLRPALSPKARKVFELLFVEETDDQHVATTVGLSDVALWQWRRRLRVQLRDALDRAAAAP